jgi:hypothetical protein
MATCLQQPPLASKADEHPLKAAVPEDGATTLFHQTNDIEKLELLVEQDVGCTDGATTVDTHGTVDETPTSRVLGSVYELTRLVKVLQDVVVLQHVTMSIVTIVTMLLV